MPEGPLGGPRPFATESSHLEKDLQSFLIVLSRKFDVNPPTVDVVKRANWIQVTPRPNEVVGRYDSATETIYILRDEVKFNVVVHEFTHHLLNVSEDKDKLIRELIEDNVKEVELLENINEIQAEKVQEEIMEMNTVRADWNAIVGVNKVPVKG